MDISPVHDRLMNFNLAYRRYDVTDLRMSRVFSASEGKPVCVNDRVCKERGLRRDSRRSEDNKDVDSQDSLDRVNAIEAGKAGEKLL